MNPDPGGPKRAPFRWWRRPGSPAAGTPGDRPQPASRARRSWPAPLTSTVAVLLLPVLMIGVLIGAASLRAGPSPTANQLPPSVASRGGAAPTPSLASTAIPSPAPTPLPSPGSSPTPSPPPVPYFVPGPATPSGPAAATLHDRAAILVDLTGRRVLYENNALEPLPTASLAKMVTILVALQHASLQTVLTVPAAATQIEGDATTMGLSVGERLTVQELIEGILLESANDAAEVLAQAILPEPQFIADMNTLVSSWGLADASFTNATGLDAPGEVASAYDLAVIAAHVVTEQPELLQISDQPEIEIPPTSEHKGYELSTLIGPVLRGFPGADGLKTGYTDNAGYCIALTDQRGGLTLLAVILDSPTDEADAEALISYGFSLGSTGPLVPGALPAAAN